MRDIAEDGSRASATRKLNWRLTPFLMACFPVACLDRSNISVAALTMDADLGLGTAMYGLAAGLFFATSTVFEIPSNLALARFGARRWIARIMVSWGAVAMLMCLVHAPWQLYGMRLLLGAAEAGFTLGMPWRDDRRSRSRGTVTLLTAILLACAGPSQARASEPSNILRLVMRTPHGGFNRMVVSVTVCEPDTERCATIDDVMVDTGSTGLRLEASAVPIWLQLPAFTSPGGKPLAECLRFVHDTAWGRLHRADVRLGGLTAIGLPLQVIDDGGGPQPAVCPRSEVHPTSNGTLGVGQHLFDCQGACEQRADAPGVFVRDGAGWSPIGGAIEPAYRLPNPVSYLPGHDNGIVIELPRPPDGGAREVAGTLTFGVGTAADDRLGTSGILHLDMAGHFTTVLGGRSYPASYIDSGTETYVFRDDSLPRCRDMAWAYCAEPRRTLDAEMVGADGTRIPTTFSVGDYQVSRGRHAGAADDVAEPAEPQSPAFVWGAPFFLGRRISLVRDGSSVPGAPGLVGPFYGLD